MGFKYYKFRECFPHLIANIRVPTWVGFVFQKMRESFQDVNGEFEFWKTNKKVYFMNYPFLHFHFASTLTLP